MTDRNKSIGASEVAALFHCSPWQSEYGLWLLKTGLVQQQASTDRLRTGQYLERAILDEWNRTSQLDPFEWNGDRFYHGKYGFITATPDGAIHEDGNIVRVCDVKTVTREMRANWNDGIPEYYRLQLQQQMLVTGAKRAVLIAQFGFDELSHEWIDADPALHEEIIKRCCEFWKRVQGELPPPEVDGSDATTNALKRRRRMNAQAINLPDDLQDMARYIDAYEKTAKEHIAKAQEIKNKVRAAMGDATIGLFGDGSGWRITAISKKEYIVKASSYMQMKRFKQKDAVEQWDGETE